jgi:hypothetical protein
MIVIEFFTAEQPLLGQGPLMIEFIHNKNKTMRQNNKPKVKKPPTKPNVLKTL